MFVTGRFGRKTLYGIYYIRYFVIPIIQNKILCYLQVRITISISQVEISQQVKRSTKKQKCTTGVKINTKCTLVII